MAQYDGSIRINTEINSKNASAQLMSLENRIVKTADKIAALRSKMDALKNTKIPTDEYKEISKQIEKAESEFDKLLEKQEKMQQEGKDNGTAWENLNDKMDEVGNTINFAKSELEDLVDTGKAFTLGADTEKYKKLGQQLKYLENDYKVLIQRKTEFEEKHNIKSFGDGYERLRDSLENLKNLLTKVSSPIRKFKEAFTFHDVDESGYDRLKNALDDLKNTANKVSGSVKKSFAELKENPLSAIAGGSLNLGNKIWDGMTAGMDGAIGKLQSGVSRIMEILRHMRDAAGNAVDSMVKAVGEKLAGFSASLINTVLHPIQTLKNVAKTSINGVASILKNGLSSAMGGLKERAAGIAASVINGLVHPFQTFKNIASSAINAVNGLLAKMQSVIRTVSAALSKVGSVLKKIGGFIAGTFKKAASMVGAFSGKIKELAQKHMPRLRKETEKSNTALSGFGRRIKELVMSALIFNQISAAFSSMISGMKKGFENFYNWSSGFKSSVENLKASVLTLKNALAAAFSPIIEIAIPYIQRLVEWITRATDKLGQLIAALTGRKTYVRAIKQTAKATEEATEETKEETKATKESQEALEGYLNPLDDVNKYLEDKPAANKIETPKLDEIEPEEEVENMFEEAPIDSYFQNLADKIKDVLAKVFAPFKAAWEREGKFVMDSWKYALGEIWKLSKDIGRDFLKVWNQPKTIDMLADMLHIIGDIGLIVGNLAKNFRAAWNYNNTGLHILENIRDILAAIIHNIRLAADYTVEWSKHLDFRPLLTSIEKLTKSLIRFADFLSGTMADFFTEFILTLTSWTLSEQGLPRLLNILAAFMNEINWEGLRAALKSLYQALEPYAEEIGTGLLNFIERIKNEGVEFFNFLPGAIQAAADSLKSGDLPAAFQQFGEIVGQAAVFAFNSIRITIESIPWGQIGEWIGSFLNGIRWEEVFSSLADAITTGINGVIDFAYNFIMTTDWKRIGTAFGMNLQRAWDSIDWQKAGVTVGEGIIRLLDFLLAAVKEIKWEKIGNDIGVFLEGIPWGGIFGRVFEIVKTVFFGLLDGLKDTLPGRIIATIGEIFALLKLSETIGAILTPILTLIFGPAGTAAGTIITGLLSMASVIIPIITQLGGDIMNGLLEGISSICSGIGTWIKEHIFDPFINWFKELFGIHSPSTVMEEQGNFIMQGLFNGIIALVDSVVGIFTDIKEKVVNKCIELKEKASEKFSELRENVKTSMDEINETAINVWNSVQTKFQDFDNFLSNVFNHDWSQNFGAFGEVMNAFFRTASDIWESVKRIFSGVIDFVAGVFTGNWSRTWEGIKNIFAGIWDGFAAIVKSPINAIIGFANRLIEAVASMVNDISRMLNSLHIDIPDWVPGIGGGKLGFNLPTWTPGKIPYLAQGTVVPPNREFMAVLGDNKREPEVVSPLSTIEQAVENAMRRNGGNQEIVIKVPIYLDGKQITEVVVKHGKIQQMSSGKNIFALG